ncbi:AAA ATPase domain-containing protein [Paenibacillus algorifonticola]|uniref:AAA ATPase domain-containing protein n=1 Tax=Paenibacillus algorifonticola TaxID=684063 RepID=A0A1I2IT01_9BACL|nr:AAA family ATPase [Paenibacillus algorifonticola]SFF44758.1 AAA ATPase domain-containing protein [Paenibacillus algorifonticola]
MYLSNQKTTKENILIEIQSNQQLFLVAGSSGTGKSFIMNQIKNEWENDPEQKVLQLIGEEYSTNVELQPFNKCFINNELIKKNFFRKKSKTSLSKLALSVPVAGEFLEHTILQLITRKEKKVEELNASLTKEQLDTINNISYLLSRDKYIIYIDNLHWWDESSLELLHEMIDRRNTSMNFLKDTIFIINLTTDQVSQHNESVLRIIKKFDFIHYDLNKIDKDNFQNVLIHFGLTKTIDIKIMDLLYKATNGHLHVIREMVKFINDNEISDLLDYSNVLKENSLSILIEERLKNYGADSVVITEILKYASIIGRSFTFFELENMTRFSADEREKNKFNIKNYIAKANELSLVEKEESGASFVHEIVRELFKLKLGDNKSSYYYAAAECLKIVRPTQYLARAQFLLQAGLMKEAGIMYLLEYVKRLRMKEFYDSSFENEVQLHANEFGVLYVQRIKKSYEFYHQEEYNNCIEELNSIESIYPSPLLAERDYLLSISLSKQIRLEFREKSVNCLEQYYNIESVDGEEEIWTRVMSALIASYVHVNDAKNAKKINRKLSIHLGDRVSFDINAPNKINILRRKSGAVESTKYALRSTEQSVAYFEPQENTNVPLNPLEYYMALNNFAANALVCGQFTKAFNTTLKALELLRDFPQINFPRGEIILNNFVLSGFLSKKISANQGIKVFQDLFEKKQLKHSDMILMQINLACLFAINENIEDARNLLRKVKQILIERKNVEYYYEYYVESNLMVVEFLAGNKLKALEIWDDINDKCPVIGDKDYYERRNEVIKTLFNNNIHSDGKTWLDMLLPYRETTADEDDIDLWEFYGKGYLFSDMQFWSES